MTEIFQKLLRIFIARAIIYLKSEIMEITDYMLEKFFMGEASSEEKEAIADWIDASSENEAVFCQAYAEYMELSLAIAGRDTTNHVSRPRRRGAGRIIAYAAGLAASLAIGFILSYTFLAKPANDLIHSTMLVSQSLPGQTSVVTLADGTTVNLNSGSRIEYPAIFSGEERRVKIHGEAMFDVTHDSEHPFVVETFAYDVKVLGTRFDVVADEEKSEFITSLLSGKVAILDKESNVRAELSPDQMVVMNDGELMKETVDDIESDHLWTDGIISVAGVPFDRLMSRFERCYGVDIEIDGDTLPEVHYGYLKIRISDGLTHALDLLQRRSNFTYCYDDMTGKYVIHTK